MSREYSTTRAPLHLNRIVFRFDKSRLPLAPGFWEDQFGQLRWNRSGWAATRCPFHQSRSGKSFSVHIDGAFFCFGCGVKGGDIVAFVRIRDRCDFPSACRLLGCWDEAGQPSPPTPVMVPVKYLVLDFTIDGTDYRASVRDSPRNYVGIIRSFYREAGDQLTALGMGQSESAEGESCWARRSLGHHELRELETL